MSMNKKKILIFSVHPDDSCLSFSGLIYKNIHEGNSVKEVEFAVGGPCSNVDEQTRINEWISVMQFCGITDYEIALNGYDGRLDQIPSCDLTGMMDLYISNYQPDEVYCTADSEHADHHALYNAFLGAARLKSGFMPKLFAVGTYLFSNQLYNEFDGGKIYQPLTEEMFKHKCEEFSLYKSQQKPSPSPLGIEGIRIMSEYHGMMCGHKYAELYYQLKYIRS